MKKRRIWITLSAVTITLMLTTIFVAQVQARRFGWAAIDGRVVAVAEDEACRDGVIVRIALDGPPIVDDVDLSLWGPGPSNYKNPDGTADWSQYLDDLDTLYLDGSSQPPVNSPSFSVFLNPEQPNQIEIPGEDTILDYNPTSLISVDSDVWFFSSHDGRVTYFWPELLDEGTEFAVDYESMRDYHVGSCFLSDQLGREYIVKKRDTLTKIAQEMYGNRWCWRPIYEANRDKLWSPHRIYAGMTLTIPPKPAEC